MNHDFEKFQKKHADLIAKAGRRGISIDDILALWAKFGPLIVAILQALTKK